MKQLALLFLSILVAVGRGEIVPGAYDLAAIRDATTLETHVVQDWRPAAKEPSIRQKVIEITVCEWWAGQKVRLPVTLNAPVAGGPCKNVIVSNMGLAAKPTLPTGAILRLLKEHGVGVVLIGMSTIDAMEPVGQLHLGMKAQLLKTKDARFTPAWIWGMSDMRALTAAVAEADAFRPAKVLATGGSKRGIGAAAAGLQDARFTAIAPVVAPMLGNPGGPYVIGTQAAELTRMDETFLAELGAGRIAGLPATAKAVLSERDERRANERITLPQARAASWSDAEIAAMNERAWDVSRVGNHLPGLQKRGLEIFYNVGANDNVSPDLLEVGRRLPDVPLYVVPGGQHGGPKGGGFTRPVPSQPEVEDNLYAFAMHHFFAARPLLAAPKIEHRLDPRTRRLAVTVTFPDGTEPQKNELWWSVNRHPPQTLAFEFDAWQALPLHRTGVATFAGETTLEASASTVEFLTTHTHTAQELALSISSPSQRLDVQ